MTVINNSYELGGLCTGQWTKPGVKITKLSDKESDEDARSRHKISESNKRMDKSRQ